MAERRMFAKTIIDSDAFLDMPLSTQALYFHLSMRADDDGFINKPKTIMRMCNCSDDDIKLLIAKKFIILFESGVVVIKHWKIHNYIRKDTYSETKYKDEKSTLALDENDAYTQCRDEAVTEPLRVSDGTLTQVRIGKDRTGKDKDKGVDYNAIKDAYNSLCPSLPSVKSLSEARKKAIRARLNQYSYEEIEAVFIKAEESNFLKGGNNRNWTANFDWIMKDANMAKVIDGNYDNRTGNQQGNSGVANRLTDTYEMMAEWAKGDDEQE